MPMESSDEETTEDEREELEIQAKKDKQGSQEITRDQEAMFAHTECSQEHGAGGRLTGLEAVQGWRLLGGRFLEKL